LWEKVVKTNKEEEFMPKKYDTPLLDELEKGPFPSFVTEMKKAAAKSDMAADELGVLEIGRAHV
jgi:hypothetical protein